MWMEGSETLDSIVGEIEGLQLTEAREGLVLHILNVIFTQVQDVEYSERGKGTGWNYLEWIPSNNESMKAGINPKFLWSQEGDICVTKVEIHHAEIDAGMILGIEIDEGIPTHVENIRESDVRARKGPRNLLESIPTEIDLTQRDVLKELVRDPRNVVLTQIYHFQIRKGLSETRATNFTQAILVHVKLFETREFDTGEFKAVDPISSQG